jgi:hypothetical protein
MPENQTPSNYTAITGYHEEKTADFTVHPATAARHACLALALERELREASSPLAALAA